LADKIYALKASGIELEAIAEHLPEYDTDPTVKKTTDYVYNQRLGYAYAMVDFLPNGWRGLLLVAFLAAYLSTISTQLNWGSSYLINDGLVPLLRTKPNEKQQVNFGRIATLLIMLIGLWVTTIINSISGVWEFIMECGAGLGLVLILRWYWGRINAWSEIAATLAPFIGYAIGRFALVPIFGEAFELQKGTFLFTVLFTTVVWIVVTFLTAPTHHQQLHHFFKKVRPSGWWKPFQTGDEKSNNGLVNLLLSWLSAVLMTYSALFAVGKLVLLEYGAAFSWLMIGLASLLLLLFSMRREERLSNNDGLDSKYG
jgi:hypothetical protein